MLIRSKFFLKTFFVKFFIHVSDKNGEQILYNLEQVYSNMAMEDKLLNPSIKKFGVSFRVVTLM